MSPTRVAIPTVILALVVSSCGATSSSPTNDGSIVKSAGRQDSPERIAQGDAFAACMERNGYVVSVRDGAAVGIRVPDELKSAYTETRNLCSAEADEVAPIPVPPREDTYEKLLETAECLRSLGYEIAPAPSLETWLETYDSGPWHPYNSLPRRLSDIEQQTIETDCPQP